MVMRRTVTVTNTQPNRFIPFSLHIDATIGKDFDCFCDYNYIDKTHDRVTCQCIFVSLTRLVHNVELSTALDFPYQHKHGMFDSQFEHLVLHFKWSDVTKITIRNWDWKQLVDPRGFQWSSNTPFSEPSVQSN